MSAIKTGQTVYEQILSLDVDGNSVTGATFDAIMYLDNSPDTATIISLDNSDPLRGVYTASWSASSIGSYQMYAKNNITGVVFVSDSISVKSESDLSTNVYIGL